MIRFLFSRPSVQAEAMPCSDCDSGYVLDEEDRAVRCQCAARRVAVAQFNRAKVPASAYPAVRGLQQPVALQPMERATWRSAGAMLDRAVQTAAAMERGDYPDDAVLFAGLVGVAGTGKTWLLADAVRKAAMSGTGCFFASMADPFSLLTQLGGGDRQLGTQRIGRVPFLAADDVGGHRHPTIAGLVRDVLLERAKNARVTVVSTRHSLDEIERELGSSVADLIRAQSVALSYGSLRGR